MGTSPYNLQCEGLVEGVAVNPQFYESTPKWKKGIKEESIESEPTSVLDNPSPPNSASTLSSCFNGGSSGLGMDDLEGLSFGEGSLLPWFMGEIEDPSLSFKHLLQPSNPLEFGGNDGLEAAIQSAGMGNFNLVESFNSDLRSCNSGSICNGGNDSVNEKGCVLNYASEQGHMVAVSPVEQFRISDVKHEVLNPKFGFCEQGSTISQNSGYVHILAYNQLESPLEPPAKRHNAGNALYTSVVPGPKSSFLGEDHEILLRNQEQQFLMQQQWLMGLAPQFTPQHPPKPLDDRKQPNSQTLVLRDQLVKIAEMFQTGNFSLAQVILARLNQQLSLSGNHFVRAATFHVKEELERLLTINSFSAAPPQPKSLTLSDVVDRMNAYKLFSEASPVMQFTDFTCTQALLEALDDADYIHILDFDIGCGSQWASFIRELPLRKRGTPFLKITAFASSLTHNPFELALVCDNILEFAKEFGVSVDLQVMNLDLFDPTTCTIPNFQSTENEAVAVNFPIWACSHCPFVLSQLLSFIKQCSPKIMTSFDRGCDHFELSFPSHIIRVLDSCSNMLESLHGSSVTLDTSKKIEKFLIKPIIERAILGRIHAPDKMQANKAHRWKNLFTSAGFFPLPFSSFTESQANLVAQRTPVRGFQVEKQQASLVLRWMSHELVAASAWRC